MTDGWTAVINTAMDATAKSWIELEEEKAARSDRRVIISVVTVLVVGALYLAYAFLLGFAPFDQGKVVLRGTGLTRFIVTGQPSFVVTIGGVVPLWRHGLGSALPKGLPTVWEIGDRTFALALDNGTVVRLGSRGQTLWSFSAAKSSWENLPEWGKPCILTMNWHDGTLGITPEGKAAWFKHTYHPVPKFLAVVNAFENGRLIVANDGVTFRAPTKIASIDSGGHVQWTVSLPGEDIDAADFGSGGDAFVVFSSSSKNPKCGLPYDGWLYCIDSQGRVRWRYSGTPNFACPWDLKVNNDKIEYTISGGRWGRQVSLDYAGNVLASNELKRPEQH